MEKPKFECFNWNMNYRDVICKKQCSLCRNYPQHDLEEEYKETGNSTLV